MAPSPSSSAADNLPFLQNQIEDNNVKSFFILHKATVLQKKSSRTRIGSSSAQSPNVTDGCNDELHDKLRMEAFCCVWSKIEITIKEVLRNINGGAFSMIYQWIHESFSAIHSCGVPTRSKITCSYPVTTDVTANKLFAGLVLTNNMESVDDLQTFSDLCLHLQSRGCHVASLSSLDFSAKNGIGLCLRSLLRQFLTVSVDAADLSVLASWYNELGSIKHPVVVIIDDINRCCGPVLSDFILLLSEWVVKIPIILLIGVATCDAPRNILSSDALLHLSIRKFILGAPADRLDAIIEAVLVKQCSGFTVGHNVANFFRICFTKHDGTLSFLTRALKVAIVQHFIMQPLSFMSRVFLDEEGSQVAVLSEAWSKQAFDLPSCRRIKCAEPKGEIWSRSLSQMKRIQNFWSSVVLCLHEAGKNTKTTLLDLYNEALDPEMYDSRASEHSLAVESDMPMPPEDQCIHGQHINMWKGGSISQMTRQVRNLSAAALCQLLERWEKLTDDVNEIHEKVKELQSSIKFEGEKSWKRELTDASKTRVSQSSLRIEKCAKASNEKAVKLLHCMIRDFMQPIECLSFHEIVCFKNVHKLQSALMGDPRRRIQVDLLEPHKILNCSCCRKSCNIPLPSMHDTSIMYALAQEHGDLINLYDWYQSFRAIILHSSNQGKHRLKQLPSPKKRKITSEHPSETEASLQARFCRAVTDLQITGLIRMPSKRRPDYVQRVAFGL